ncbi:TPA: hypothetical protein IAD52_09815 [Candidatus Spyradomonas excrementavium]|nr:hypothetical protein [Candidatus Spyradomonas excrementavium]
MMKLFRTFLILTVIFFAFGLPSEARKLVLKITPAQNICTKDGSIQKDDVLDFAAAEDVLREDGSIYITKGTPVKAMVSFVQSDAWVGDSSILDLSHFETNDVEGNPIAFDYNLKITGKYGLSTPSELAKYFVKSFFFYANLNYKPNEVVFNVLFDE